MTKIVDSEFVQTCDELVIDVRDIEAQYTRMSFMESVSFKVSTKFRCDLNIQRPIQKLIILNFN